MGSRTYALFNKNKIILAMFVSLGLTVIVIAAVRIRSDMCGSVTYQSLFVAARCMYRMLLVVQRTKLTR